MERLTPTTRQPSTTGHQSPRRPIALFVGAPSGAMLFVRPHEICLDQRSPLDAEAEANNKAATHHRPSKPAPPFAVFAGAPSGAMLAVSSSQERLQARCSSSGRTKSASTNGARSMRRLKPTTRQPRTTGHQSPRPPIRALRRSAFRRDALHPATRELPQPEEVFQGKPHNPACAFVPLFAVARMEQTRIERIHFNWPKRNPASGIARASLARRRFADSDDGRPCPDGSRRYSGFPILVVGEH
jgi:hypothetical protein